ncbi:phospholipase D family protein [Photobacterium satsumensis]|uniref:phospholipase D family protein n=1 Tax=Photobacterium satsumensis TaxID=2910239 RepID=UPI003D1222ED
MDLNTLLTVPVAMCFGHTLEGPIEQERIALLEALGQLKGCLKVYYQHGNIKIPSDYNSLFTLLEPCLAPVVPLASKAASHSVESAFSSFHPKVWLLRFEGKAEDPVRYRLIVLSRNLTFDRSWDLAAVIDGFIKPKSRRQNRPLVAFFESLFGLDIQATDSQYNDFAHQETILSELPYVFWQKPNSFGDIGFLSTVFDEKTQLRQKPVAFKHTDNTSMLVVSPFIKGGSDVAGLDWLATYCPDGPRYLLSRAEELNAVGESLLSDWHCFSLNDRVINGEEAMELDQSEFVENDQNLHAKLIVNDQSDGHAVWHVGSANATAAALGTTDKSPRNTEFMLQLKGLKEKVGVESLLNQWIDNDGFGLFVEHEFTEPENNEDVAESENALRIFMHQLLLAQWQLIAVPDSNMTYSLKLSVDALPPLEEFSVRVTPLAAEQFRTIEQALCWYSLKLSQVSALVRFEIIKGSDTQQQFMLQLPLEVEGDIDREAHVLNELVQSQSQFYSYLSMLLQVQPDKSLFYSSSKGDGIGDFDEQGMIPEDAIIYEKLMLAAAKRPESLKRIDMLQKRLDESVIPQVFKDLWHVFQPFSQ